MVQIPLAPWRSPLARALHRNRSRVDSRYPQLATVRPDGRPANRTVVFRDFRPDTNCLLFVTDRRSQKITELTHHPVAELGWYFPTSREQFRIGGAIAGIDAEHPDPDALQLRQQVWARLSDNAREQFAWPHPGHPRAATGFEPVHPNPQVLLDTFVVLVLTPDWVDHLELRGEPQNRHQYWLVEGAWHSQEVNP